MGQPRPPDEGQAADRREHDRDQSHDPIDCLRLADYGGHRIRFRCVGLTTSFAQTIDDQTAAVVRRIVTAWTGERQLDWTGASSNIRCYGPNAHLDTVWTASSASSS